jgi:hypothetical protein
MPGRCPNKGHIGEDLLRNRAAGFMKPRSQAQGQKLSEAAPARSRGGAWKAQGWSGRKRLTAEQRYAAPE